MFDTILTRKKRRHQRFIASILAFVMMVMALPVNAFAAGVVDRDFSTGEVIGTWYPSADDPGAFLGDFSYMQSVFNSNYNQVNKMTGDSVADGNFVYKGLNNVEPSTLWVMENFIKYLLLLDWADSNMVATDNLTYRYNLFFNNTGSTNSPGQVPTTGMREELADAHTALFDLINDDKFKFEFPAWGATDVSKYVGNIKGSHWNLSRNMLSRDMRPGGAGELRSEALDIWMNYYWVQMAYMIIMHTYGNDQAAIKEAAQDVLGHDTIESPRDAGLMLEAAVQKLLQVKENSSGITTETVVDGGEATTVTSKDGVKFNDEFDIKIAGLLGDTAAISMVGATGNSRWALSDATLNNHTLQINTDISSESNTPLFFAYSNTLYGGTMDYPSLSGLITGAETFLGIGESKDWPVEEVYVMYGKDLIMAGYNEVYGADSETVPSDTGLETITTTVLNRFDAAVGLIADRPLKVRILPIMLTGDERYDVIIDNVNAQLASTIRSAASTAYSSGNADYVCEYLDFTSSSGVSTYWSNMATAIDKANKITGTNSSGESVELNNEVGKSGLNTGDLLTLYSNVPGLQEFFDSYKRIETFVNTLYPNHFQDDTTVDGMIGYYKRTAAQTMELFVFSGTFSVLDDVYQQAYIQDLVGLGTSNAPSANAPDPNSQVEKAKSALSLISNCDFSEDEYLISCADGEGNESLSIIGYEALAAGVVYDPFVSIEGNATYIAVIKDVLGADGTKDGNLATIERFLHQALQRKKPVYVIDGSYSDWLSSKDVEEAPTGNYRYAYVADLLQGEENVTRCYTVMKGGMAPSAVDSDTWVYAQGTPRGEGGDRTDDGTYITTGAANTTPAGSSTMATASEMSAPIMFTSGTTEGFWKGNAAGSASGYAASLGGLTTLIIHNAAQDAKDNEYIQNAESYMLFMNGLGDIVLADGTIILPAIANPAIYVYDNIQYSVEGSVSFGSVIAGLITGAVVTTGAIVAVVASGGTATPVVIGLATAGGGLVGAGTGAVANWATQTTGDLFWGETDGPEVVASYDSHTAYYPYTAAFMNHYPSTSVNLEGKLAVTNANDKGKYVIGIDDHGDVLARRIKGFNNKTQVNLQYSGGGVTVAMPQALSFNVESNITKIGTLLPFVPGEDGTFGSKFNTANKFEYYMVKYSAFNSNDQAFFPLESSTDAALMEDYFNRAGPLVTSAKRYLMARHPTGEATEPFSGFNVKRYIYDMAGQGLMGTMYGETLQKNYQISYDELVEDTGNRLLTFFVQLVESAVDTLGNIDGVLAIKNGYENSFFNMLVSFIQEFYALIVVALMIIVAVKFLRGHYNMIFVVFIAAMCFCGFEVYANWMPTMVPNMYNFAVNDAVEQIVWNTVAVSAESYSETYADSSRKDPTTGEPKPYTATMTMYKMSRQDMYDMASRLGTTYTDLKKGTIYYLDENAGIFVQGDSIKISIDRLLVNNSMRGLHQSQWETLSAEFAESDGFITPITRDTDMIGNPYSVQITNPYVSLEAYYMPFNEIERAFLVQLNKFANVFRMEHNVFNYSRNMYKDAFLFNNYTNSGIFTAPGNKEVLTENIRIGSVVSRYIDPEKALEDFLSRIYGGETKDNAVFPVPEDWLGVAAVFRSPSENFKDSLWGKAMQNKGWYDENWNITNPDKLNDLIYYMNTQTKQFVIANSDQLNFCSDENAIKIVSLYATTTFTHYVSEIGGWLYPNYVNAADISLKDALYGSMTTLKDRNFSYDGTVVNTVAYNLGVFGVLFILLITVFACVFVFVMTYLVPILYAMFGAIIIFKLINNSNGVGLVKGYIKVTGVTCLLYFIFSLSMRLVEVGGYAWYGYLGCALLMFLCCYFLFWVVLSVIQNAGELGNDVLGQNLLRGLDHITHGAVRKLTASNFMAQRMNRGYGARGYAPFGAGAYQYGRNYGVDSFDYVRGDRSRFARAGRYEEVYDDYGRDSPYEAGGRHFGRFGRGRTTDGDRRTATRFRR